MKDTTARTGGRTFRGPGGTAPPGLEALAGVQRVETGPQQVLETERYDTDDRRLAAAGVVLALRRGEDGAPRWQLELPDADAAEHLTVPLASDAGSVPQVPEQLDELVRGHSRERAVRPAGRVRTVRTRTRLLDADDRLLMEVVHADVALATLGRATQAQSWTEVELQLGGTAGPALLSDVEMRLSEAGLRPAAPAGEAELDRLLRPVPALRTPGAVGRRSSAGAALVHYLATHVDRLAAEDLRVRRGEPDAVHQLRVASRRLRSALQAYGPLLDRERTDPLVDGLRDLGRHLAPARDAEVLHERISQGLAALAPELLLGPVRAQVTRHFTRLEAETLAAVLTTLDGEAYRELRTALDELVQRPPLRRRAARAGHKELPAQVARTARRLERAVRTATDTAAEPAVRDEAVHDARKAGKRLRYATEVAEPVVGKEARAFTKALKGFQEALGQHQDTVVARDALRELGALAHEQGENGFSFGVLHGRDTALAARIEEELPALWTRTWTRRTTRWLR